MKEIKVGIIGFGTVGSGVVENILRNGTLMMQRSGVKLTLSRIADLDITTDRGVKVPAGILTTDANLAIKESDIVVELIGGTTIAKDLILSALRQGKSVVTANKALLALHGKELFAAAKQAGVDLYYEASVAGGIPIIKSLREGLSANRIERIYGIMNGTCNYILTRMAEEKMQFNPILKDAQELGYAEAKPSLDIDGFDTAHKAIILANLAYGTWFDMDAIRIEGIRDIEPLDIEIATTLGYKVKLLAIIKEVAETIQIRVHPTFVSKGTALAQIDGVFNGVFATGDTVGDTLFYGQGAGRAATASAVVADLIDVGLNLNQASLQRIPVWQSEAKRELQPKDDLKTRYYLRLAVNDATKLTQEVETVLTQHNIVAQVKPYDNSQFDNNCLIVETSEAVEKDVNAAVEQLQNLTSVTNTIRVFRIEDL